MKKTKMARISLASNSIITTVALLLLCSTVLFAAEKKIILPEGAKPGGNYNPGSIEITVTAKK